MASKPKTPALDRLVRRESKSAYVAQGQWLPTIEYTRRELRGLIQRVAAECARIAREKARRIQEHELTGAPAVESVAAKIEREFGIEEGEDA